MPVSIDTSNKFTRLSLWIVLIVYSIILTKLVIFKRSPGYVKKHVEGLLHHYSWRAVRSNMQNGNFNLKPFATIKLYLNANIPAEYTISNLLGNIIGFIPLGLLLPLLFIRLRSATATIFSVLLVSFCFELFQLLTMTGVCDIDDLILNTTGGIIGYLFFLFLKKIIPVY